jgi:hypothetical protein
MGVYWYLTNITKNQEIFLGKTGGLDFNYFLDLFNENKWEYTDEFRVANDNYDKPFYIRFHNNLWEYLYPPTKEEIICQFTKSGECIEDDE